MKNLIDQSGLIAESDYLSLSRTLAIKQSYLVDHVIGARHKLHRKALNFIELLEQPIPFELWRQYGHQQKLKDDEMLDILLFLNSIGALQIKRALRGQISIIPKYLRMLINGQLPVRRTRRWEANFINTSRAVLLAMQPLIAAAVITSILAYGASIDIAVILIITQSFLLSIWLSTILHEQAHSFVISKSTKNHILVQRGLRLGILHRRLPIRIELISAFMGPLVGAITSLVCGVALGIMYRQLHWTFIVGVLVACFQLISLLPAYGDGRIVWDKLKGVI